MPGVSAVGDTQALAFADYDRDGNMDFALSGYAGWQKGYVTEVWRNVTSRSHPAPPEPHSLRAQSAATGVTLTWQSAAGGTTPAVAQSSNLRVGTTPGAGNIVSPQTAANGQLLLPGMGNRHLARRTRLHLPRGIYYWSVQSVDAGWMAGPFAEEKLCGVGTPQEIWRARFFPAAPAGSIENDPLDDPDHDGAPNLLEMAAGTNPLAANTALSIQRTGDGVTLLFSRFLPAAPITPVILESTVNASAGPWLTVTAAAQVLSSDGLVEQVSVAIPSHLAASQFFRLRATAP